MQVHQDEPVMPSPPATIQEDRSPEDKRKRAAFLRSPEYRDKLLRIQALAGQLRKKRG